MTQNEAQSERGFHLHLHIRSSKTIAKQSKNQAKSVSDKARLMMKQIFYCHLRDPAHPSTPRMKIWCVV
jgi:hypothetical protein